jgi:hypothetical protein
MLAAVLGIMVGLSAGAKQPVKQQLSKQVTWRFDDTALLGGHVTKVLGRPQVIETAMGKAIAFNGADDALVSDVHPLAGA